MKIKLIGLTLSSIIAISNAKQYYFNAVSINDPSYTLGVKVNGQVINLTSKYFPLFTGVVNTDNVNKYKYVLIEGNGNVVEEEKFERIYSDETAKLNEVYNRINKKIEIPKLPEPLGNDFPMGSEKFQPFPKNEIYNVFANCDEAQYDDRKNFPFFSNRERNDEPVNCTITIVSSKNVFQSPGSIHLSGFGSRLYKKLSWVMKFNNKFMGRSSVKIRGVANDASLMRDKLSADLYRAMGVPVQEGTYARVIINNDVWGLYTFVDSHNKKWYANYIHGDNKSHIGTSYKIVSSHPNGPFADLKYKGDNADTYASSGTYDVDEIDSHDSEVNINESGSEWNRLVKFVKLFDEWEKKYKNDTSDASFDALNNFLDVEQTLRMMSIDALTVALDNFWFVQSNTLIYYNPEVNKYQFIPYDFDESLKGHCHYFDFDAIKGDCLTWADVDTNGSDHYFTKAILAHPQVKNRYRAVLAGASRFLFTVEAVTPYIDAVSELIKEDVEWNFSLAKNYNSTYDGIVNYYTIQHFNDAANFGKVSYEKNVVENSIAYGLKRFIQIRGDGCRAYTRNVPTKDIQTSSSFNNNTKATILFILIQAIIYLIF